MRSEARRDLEISRSRNKIETSDISHMAASYLQRLSSAFSTENSQSLRTLIDFNDTFKKGLLPHINNKDSDSILLICQAHLQPESLQNMASARFSAMVDASNGKFVPAFKAHLEAVKCFGKMMRGSHNWILPAWRMMLSELMELTQRADEVNPIEASRFNDVSQVLRDIYVSYMYRDDNSYDLSLKWGCMFTLGFLYYSLFKADKDTMLADKMSLPDDMPKHKYPLPDQVSFSYWQGRLKLSEMRLSLAAEYLIYAFRNCPKTHANRERILWCLVPVQLNLCLEGAPLPSEKMFKDFTSLLPLQDLLSAFRLGNVAAFDRNLLEHEGVYVRKQVYLLLCNLRPLLWRNLCKRIWLCSGKQSRIPVAAFGAAMKMAGLNGGQPDEVECVLSSLTRHGYMKGNIGDKWVVLKPQGAFPFVRRTTR